MSLYRLLEQLEQRQEKKSTPIECVGIAWIVGLLLVAVVTFCHNIYTYTVYQTLSFSIPVNSWYYLNYYSVVRCIVALSLSWLALAFLTKALPRTGRFIIHLR